MLLKSMLMGFAENPFMLDMLMKQNRQATKGREQEFMNNEFEGHGDAGVQFGKVGKMGFGHINYSSLLSR